MSIACSKDYTLTLEAGAPTPIAYWKCDEASALTQLENEVDPAYPLVGSGGTFSVVGKIAGGQNCNGCQYAYPVSAFFDFSGESFTVRLWVNFSTLVGTDAVVATNNKWNLYRIGSDLQWTVKLGLNWIGPIITPITAGTWHRVIVWHEQGVGIGMKVDDDASSTVADTGTIVSGNQSFTLGNTFMSHNWDADEVGIWLSKWSDAEMTTDWNGGAGKTYP